METAVEYLTKRRAKQLIKGDWKERTDMNKRHKSWFKKYYSKPKNNEEGC